MSDSLETATLTGLAIGDALGMPFETHPPTSPALLNWDGTFQSGATNTRQPQRQPGEWTDDTKMAMALADSLIISGCYSPAHVSSNYIDWYHSGDLRGIGKTTREAMDRLIKGHHWNSSGVLHAKGNGPSMRIAPMGVFYRSSLLTVAEMTRVDAWITHRSQEAQEGAVAVALAVALLAQNKVDKEHLIKPVLHLIQGPESHTTLTEARLSELGKFLAEKPSREAAVQYLIEKGTSAVTEQTVPAAFLCFMVTDSFKDAVEMAVRAGGDTDTVGAITGALAGTYYGKEQVEPYVSKLEDGELLRHLDHLLWLEGPVIPEDI
jgi:ADP-ribosylglycohydrolase